MKSFKMWVKKYTYNSKQTKTENFYFDKMIDDIILYAR